MATQDSKIIYFDENDTGEWQNAISEPSLRVVNPSYLSDLKNALEFDRRYRALETLFDDVNKRIHAIEMQISKIRELETRNQNPE